MSTLDQTFWLGLFRALAIEGGIVVLVAAIASRFFPSRTFISHEKIIVFISPRTLFVALNRSLGGGISPRSLWHTEPWQRNVS